MNFQKQYLLKNAKHLNLHECRKTLIGKFTSKTGNPLRVYLKEWDKFPSQEPSWVLQILNFTFKGIIVTRLPKNQLQVSLPEEITETDVQFFYEFIFYVKERNKRLRIIDTEDNQSVVINNDLIRSLCQKQRAWFEGVLSSDMRLLERLDGEIVAYRYQVSVLKKTRPNNTMDELVDEMQLDLIKIVGVDPSITDIYKTDNRSFVMKWDSSVSNFREEDFIQALNYR